MPTGSKWSYGSQVAFKILKDCMHGWGYLFFFVDIRKGASERVNLAVQLILSTTRSTQYGVILLCCLIHTTVTYLRQDNPPVELNAQSPTLRN